MWPESDLPRLIAEMGQVRLSVPGFRVSGMAMLPNPLPHLSADPSGTALGLRLPPGILVDQTTDGPWPEPLMWHAEDPSEPGAWAELLPARTVGLHPVLIEFDAEGLRGPGAWDLMPQETSYPGDHDAEEVLADSWEVEDEDDLDHLAPYGAQWPGLAPALTPEADPDERAASTAAELIKADWLDNARIALVHARRSADIPAAIGWTGPLNHENDVAVLCSVLRSWEDRFGIRVIALSFDRLTVSVAAPPRTQEQAEAVAAEHYAFCPDNITQGNHDSLREYAEKAVLDLDVWNFWWD